MTQALCPQLRQQILATRTEYRAREQTTWLCDRLRTESIIRRVYARLQRSSPHFVWYDGPLSCLLAVGAIFRCRPGVVPAPGRSLQSAIKRYRDELRFRLAAATQQQLEPAVCDALGTKHWMELEGYEQLHDGESPEIDLDLAMMTEGFSIRPAGTQCPFDSRIGRKIQRELTFGCHSVSDELRGRVASTLGLSAEAIDIASLRLPSQNAIWGAENQCWISHHVACQLAGVRFESDDAERLSEWDALSCASGWWFPFENLVLCAERPVQARQDFFGELHNERGPALEYRDGWKAYCRHGVDVPAEWIEHPEKLSPEHAFYGHNTSQRFAAAAIVGWARVIERLSCRVIDHDPDPSIGTLLECELPNFGPARFLRVRCATGREFVLCVPSFVNTARDANAWTYGLSKYEYQLEART